MEEKKLSVNNLVISFRTPGGKVQAVRNISFDLHKGETLAIVGESGSGKSVTSKAILGILAGNSIVEGGSIIYDGMDLLKVGEDEFYRIRGDRIAMIFQDPLSSLNPIMRIGKQLTEAMLLKGRARQKSSKVAFNTTLDKLAEAMAAARPSEGAQKAAQMCKNFDRFEIKHIELEKAYGEAHEAAGEALDAINDVLFHIEKNAFEDQKYSLKEILRLAGETGNEYVVSGGDAERLKKLLGELKSCMNGEIRKKDYPESVRILKELAAILQDALKKEQPDFSSMGCYLVDSGKPIPDMPAGRLNSFLKEYADEHFMNEFRAWMREALEYNARTCNEKKKLVIDAIGEKKPVFAGSDWDRKACQDATAALCRMVKESIDPLEVEKDGEAYTFAETLKAAVDDYFEGIRKNRKAVARHDKQQKKYDRQKARGKEPGWKVPPSTAVDLDLARDNVNATLDRMASHYQERLENAEKVDFVGRMTGLEEFFKENASGVVMRITKTMAKYKALKLMEEVGISETRKRYRQYPFEFSGGMRQRIVIAIALAANPDILICDEPTTALDVTIQAQILELINKLKKDRNLSIIFITHDLGVVANMADRIAVMYAGKIVETGTSEDIFYSPAHPYTWALLSAMPDLETNERLEAIPGTPPNMIFPPVGDAFADRNKYALKIDFELQPPMFRISETHSAATWLLHPDAPKVEPPKIVTDRIARMKSKGGAVNAE